MKQYNNVKELFILDYYDIPLSLMVLDEDQNYLFATIDPNYDESLDNNESVKYFLHIPTVEQLCLILGQHELFQRYVGNNWELEDGPRPVGDLKPESMWHKYYDMFRQVDPHGLHTYKTYRTDIDISSPVGFYTRY